MLTRAKDALSKKGSTPMRTEHPKARRNRKKAKSRRSIERKERASKQALYQKKDVLFKYKLTQEPSLITSKRLSERAIAHHESKSSKTTKGRITRKSVAQYRNQKGKSHPRSVPSTVIVIKKGRVTHRVLLSTGTKGKSHSQKCCSVPEKHSGPLMLFSNVE